MESIVSIIITVLFGFVANKTKILDSKSNHSINQLIIKLTLPASIFSGMISIDSNNFNLLITSSINIIVIITGLFIFSYVISFIIFKDKVMAVTLAMLISLPGVLFYGLPILTPILHDKAIAVISATGIVQNLVILPFIFTIFSRHNGKTVSYRKLVFEPIIISPILAIGFILMGLHVPVYVTRSLELIGQCTTGLALISTGVILSQMKFIVTRKIIYFVVFKNLILPITLIFILKLTSVSYDHSLPLILINAIPIGSICIIISTIYNIYVKEVSSIVTLSILFSSASLPIIYSLL
jgi:malonate transporter and related proteins